MLYLKILRKFKYLYGKYFIQYPRIIKYRVLSNCKRVIWKPVVIQPTQLSGDGTITFGKHVKLGFNLSPFFYNGYGYIDARTQKSIIKLGDNVSINNNPIIISEGAGIEIGSNTLIGFNVEITDSDFHDLNPNRRRSGTPKTNRVRIGENVFIGSNVTILKGVTIGNNSVIANRSVVTKSLPDNVIAGGYPCKVLKHLELN